MPREKTYVTNSEIQTFKRCRRKWWFAYYRKLGVRRPEVTGPRSIGTRVHECVAAYYAQRAAADPGGSAWPLSLHDQIVAADLLRCPDEADKITKEADLSRAMLEGYFEWLEETGADEGLTVVAAEQAIEHSVLAPKARKRVVIRSKLDLIVHREQDDAKRFLDHKTVQEFTTPTRTLHLDEQMLLYDWMVGQVFEQPVGGAIYNMIRKVKRTANAKPPFYERFEVRHSQAEIDSFMRRTLGTIDEMIRARRALDKNPAHPEAIVYPTPTRNCSWDCDFYAVCPLVDRPDIGSGEGLIETLYEVVDPNARYADARGELS